MIDCLAVAESFVDLSLVQHMMMFFILKRRHSVSLGIDPPLANHNPVIFSVPPGTEKLAKSS